MRNILMVVTLLTTSVLTGQIITVRDNTVYMDTNVVGTIKSSYETYITVGGGDRTEKVYVLNTNYVFSSSVIKLMKKDLYPIYGDVKVKQGGGFYNNTITHSSDANSYNTMEAGKAIKNSVSGQILSLLGVPICFIHPVFGGIIIVSGYIYNITELNRAGAIMMNEM